MAYAYQYDPYGVPTVTEDSGGQGRPINPYQFKGGIHDRTTNWVKYGYRWYSVGTGRFTQRDTLDAPLDPANANRYAFAANDPVNNSDPLGLMTDETKAALGCAASVAGLFISAAGIITAPATGGASLALTLGVGGYLTSGVGILTSCY